MWLILTATVATPGFIYLKLATDSRANLNWNLRPSLCCLAKSKNQLSYQFLASSQPRHQYLCRNVCQCEATILAAWNCNLGLVHLNIWCVIKAPSCRHFKWTLFSSLIGWIEGSTWASFLLPSVPASSIHPQQQRRSTWRQLQRDGGRIGRRSGSSRTEESTAAVKTQEDRNPLQ